MQKRSIYRYAALLALVVLIAAACGGGTTTKGGSSGTPGAGGIVQGGILRMAGDHIDNMNPYKATSQDAYTVFTYIYPELILFNETYDDFVGDFATSWEVSPDGKTWTFKTREGAKWSDGTPMTANDVVATLNMDMAPGSGATGVVSHMTKAEAPDDNTVVITYEKPVGNVLSQLQQVPIVPEHIWGPIFKKGGVTDLRNYQNTDTPIVGGGPFVVSEYREDEFVKFDVNPNWYGDKPIIDGFGMQFFKNDEATIAALENDEIDLIEFLAPSGVDPLKAANIPVVNTPGVEFHDIIFNSNPKNPNNPELRDPQLRLAMEYAVDRQRLIDVAMFGFATPGSSIVPPVTGKWFNSELPVVPFDLDKANQVLDDAGYTMGSDGVRTSPEGERLSYEVMADKDQSGVNRVFEILKENWAKIGVEVRFKPLTYNQLWAANQEPMNAKTGVGEYLDFQIILWDWVPVVDPDFILSVLLCNQYSSWSDTGYCDPEYDRMYSDQGTTVDPKARKDLVWQMQEKLYAERPYIVMYYLDSLYAHSPKWDGFISSFQGPFNFMNRDSLMQAHQVG